MKALALASHLRPLTGLEENWMITRETGVANIPAACHELLACCLVGLGKSLADRLEAVRLLTIAERDWLVVELRRRSFGSRIQSEARCPSCGSAVEIEFATEDLPIQPTTVREHFEIQLPTGKIACLRPLTAGDHEQFVDKTGLDSTAQLALALERALVSLDGGLENLAIDDRTALDQALAASIPEEIQLNLECQSCGQQLTAPFDPCTSFFAELKEHSRTLLDDVHTLARAYHWSEREILRLPLRRRLAYLMRIEAENDAALIQSGGQVVR